MSEKKPENLNNESESDQDLDFDPTADMMVNDFDDEHTLEEEEALEDDNSNELDDLQRESEMPLEELLAMYGNLPDNATVSNSDEETDQTEVQPSDSTSTSQLDNNKYIEKIEPVPVSSNLSRLISTNEDALYEISDDEEDVEDDIPDLRRTIRVGQDYQASVPDSLPTENSDEIDNHIDLNSILLWNPKQLNEKEIQNYLDTFLNQLKQINSVSKLTTSEITSTTNHVLQKDSELALYLLLKNDYKPEKVLSKADLEDEHFDLFTFIESWSEEDCSTFEDGLRIHGKDFYQIQKNRLPHKKVRELVHFYYLWKKTERHDVFAGKFKFEKRKYSLNPTITDLMDHFLDENQPQQPSLNSTSFSSNSQNIYLHTDHHSYPLGLLPKNGTITDRMLSNMTDHSDQNASISESANTNVTSSDQQSIMPNNIHNEQIEENSNQSSNSPTSKLIINEVIDTFGDDEQSDELVSSSSVSNSVVKDQIKSDECSISSSLTPIETSLTTATTNSSEL